MAKVGRPMGAKFPKEYRIRMTNEDYEKLAKIAKVTGTKVSVIIRTLIKEFIDKFEVMEF